MAPATKKSSPDLRIPAEVRVAIIGHWTPEQEKLMAPAVKAIQAELEEVLHQTPATFTLVPGLSQDAERLWESKDFSFPSLTQALIHYLPGESRRYFRSFKTVRERTTFFKAVRAATENLPSTPDAERGAAEQAIRDCEVLIAFWTPPSALSPAGVAPLIRFALESAGRTLYWIDPATGETKRYDNYDRIIDSFMHLNRYNRALVNPARIASEVRSQIKRLDDLASEAGFSAALLDPLHERVIPHFVRAERLAAFWQRCYILAGSAIYLFAALGVASGTIAILVPQEEMAFVEVASMALILIIIGVSETVEVLRCWLDYRFLAERLRASIHLYVAGMSSKMSDEDSGQWMSRALRWICLPKQQQPMAGSLEAAKYFTRKGWVEDQRNYYFQRSGEFELWQKWSLRLGFVLFVTAAGTAFSHALHWFHAPKVLAGTAIIAAALGASMAGFRAFREFHRTALQYVGMVRKLNHIASRIKQAATPEDLKDLLAQADDAIIQEHQGWRVLVHVHEPIDEL